MENLLNYLLKLILCSGVMFLYYRLFLKDKTFHHYNRFYLLATLAVSLLLPFLKVSTFTVNINQNIYDLLQLLQSENSSKTSSDDFTIYRIIFTIFVLVSIFFILKFILGLIKIKKIKKQFPEEQFEGISFYNTNLEHAPFSFFRNLFWKKSILIQSELGKQILKHEMVHIEQKHTYDKIFVEILTAIFWFNPIFYLIKKEINLIHEYLADKKALKNSDTKAFAQMLLETHFSGITLAGTSPFLNSNLKKRITMLKKSNTKFSYWRKVLALPLLFSLVFAYMVKAENREIKKNNQKISLIVSSIKKDTIKKDTVARGKDATKEYSEHPERFYDSQAAHQAKLDAEQARKDAEQAVLDAKQAKFIETQARKGAKKAKIAQEKARIDQIQAQKNAKISRIDQDKTAKDEIRNAQNFSFQSINTKTKPIIFIDGVENDKIAMKDLNKFKIKSINIIKSKTGGKDEVRIETNGKKVDDDPWIINVGAHNITPPQSKLIAKTTFTPESEVDGNKQAVSDQNLKDSKIYINGNLSDEKTAKSIKLKDIKKIEISNATNNGYQYKKVHIFTK